jgi:phospholipid transport system substrate-binding protein
MRRLNRRTFLACASIAAADRAIAPAWSTPANADTPLVHPLQELYDALTATMRAGRSSPFAQRFNDLAPIVDQVFDLETILKVSIGLRWDSLDTDMRARLLRAFRRFTVATYVANFDKYDGERFRILPNVRESGADRIVETEIISGDNQRIRVDYIMRDAGGTWRAIDVLLEGSISRVAVQRSDFRKILAKGDAEALIASLQRKIADLSGGALNS